MAERWDGLPENPERDGWHWVEGRGYAHPTVFPAFWMHAREIGRFEWRRGGGGAIFSQDGAARWWCYLGPCLTPDEHRAALAAARREGAEAMREQAARACERSAGRFRKLDAEYHGTATALDAQAAAIRALPLPPPPSEEAADG